MGFFDKIIKKGKGEAKRAESLKDQEPSVSGVPSGAREPVKGSQPAKKEKKPQTKKEKVKKDKPAEEAKPEKKKGATRRKTVSGEASRIILRPVFTEKAERMQAYGKYTFMVSGDANKVEVARAIRDLYGVKPVSVRVLVSKGKSVRSGRTRGRRKDEKKAVVTLPPGQIITVMESA